MYYPSTCKVRIWDSGDMTDCGEPLHKNSDRCEYHLKTNIKWLRTEIARLEIESATRRAELRRREVELNE